MKAAKTWTPKQIEAAEKTLSAGTWAITAGAILFSVLTVTPLVKRVTPDEWDWTAPILPLVVDAAVVIVIRLDATVSRLGGKAGAWPVVLRWLTGMFTVALNIGDSALNGKLVGVAVHAVAPALLIVTAEAGLAYRRAIAGALDRLEREQAEEEERRRVHERQEREAHERQEREREQREREEREREQERVERLERERLEHQAKREREAREYEARMAREQREHEAELRREEAARIEREQERERQAAERERAERERQQQAAERAAAERERQRLAAERERAERERQAERERAERAERERQRRAAERERAERERVELLSGGPAADRLPEERARAIVAAAVAEGLPVRAAAELCGWSVGWVSQRYRELRSDGDTPQRLAMVAGSER